MTIDPLASLMHLDDRHIPAICAGLLNKKYVVYVAEGNGKLFNPLIPYHEHTVEFLMHGLPRPFPEACIDAAMTMPVFPGSRHPLGRAPLRPSTPLPWPDCYLSPFITAHVRCRTLVSDASVPYQLDIPEQLRHDAFVTEDWRRRAEGQAFRAALARCPAVHRRPTSTDADAGTVYSSVEARSSDAEYSSSTGSTSAEVGSVEADQRHHTMEVALFRNAKLAKTPPNDMTTVVFTHDLSGVEQLSDPLDFFAEQDTLRMIADGSRFRREYAIKQAERSNAETYDAPTVRLLKRTRVLRVLSGIRRSGKRALRRIFLLHTADSVQ